MRENEMYFIKIEIDNDDEIEIPVYRNMDVQKFLFNVCSVLTCVSPTSYVTNLYFDDILKNNKRKAN